MAVVRRGEGTSSDEDSDDSDVDDRVGVEAGSERGESPASLNASGRNASVSSALADASAGEGSPSASPGRPDSAPRTTTAGSAPVSAMHANGGVPNTKLVAGATRALREARIARAEATTRARERDAGVLKQTSASISSVNSHLREASLAAKEARDALRRLTSVRGDST